jgi:hypothetical protein
MVNDERFRHRPATDAAEAEAEYERREGAHITAGEGCRLRLNGTLLDRGAGTRPARAVHLLAWPAAESADGAGAEGSGAVRPGALPGRNGRECGTT